MKEVKTIESVSLLKGTRTENNDYLSLVKRRAAATVLVAAVGLAAACSADAAPPVGQGKVENGYFEDGGAPSGANLKYSFDTEHGEGTIYCNTMREPQKGESTESGLIDNKVTVKKGQNLTSLAENVGHYWAYIDQETPAKEAVVGVIAELNSIKDPNSIYPGEELVVPVWCDTPRN